jgi:hypothetical protein
MTRLPVVRCDKSPPGVASVGWRRPRCAGRRVASSEDTALASTSTTVVVALIYAGTVVLYVGTTALIVRAWTRRQRLARKPERPALHRCQCGAARECWNCNRSRVANRNGAWLFQIVHMKLAVSAKVLPESSEYFRSSKSMSGPGLSGVCIQARRSAAPGGPPGARWSMLHSPSGADRTERHELHRSGNQRSCSQRRLRVPLVEGQ